MKARGLIPSMIALTAGCTAAGGIETDDLGAAYRVEQIEVATDGLPSFARGELGRVASRIDDVAGAPAALAGVLPAIADTLRVPAADLVAARVDHDELGMTHVRLAQQKHGLRVVGGDVVLHLGADGTVRSVNSTARDRAIDATPALAADEAARAAVQATDGPVDATHTELVYVVANRDGELYLAWEVDVFGRDGVLRADKVYVDAHTGRVVDRHPQVFTIRNRVIRNGQGTLYPYPLANPPPPQIGTETSPPTGDATALAAYTNTGLTYDCYKALFNRDSYNNAGATLTSVVHVVFPAGGGQTSPNNAVWYPPLSQMAYGDGDGTLMKPLALALDVTAHELTHAVTSSTANLVYMNESGALNEAMSDIMAAVCEAWNDRTVNTDTWLVGEDIWTPAMAGDALRYMANPTLDGNSRDYYPERFTGPEDNGGVHYNSGIPNLAFYLLANGGTHPRSRTTHRVPALGIERAGTIFQRALTQGYFTMNTTMALARTTSEQAAQDLYPGTCARAAVSLAWATVGVGAGVPADAVPPTVAIAAPANGERVTAGFQVQVTTSDDQCLNKVELSIDGALVGTSTVAPYTFTTSAGLAAGPHTVQVTSYDAFNQSTSTANVTVAGVCTTDDQCSDTEHCNGSVCELGAPAVDVTGCGCGTDLRGGTRGALGSLALMLATAFALRRRRTRR